MFVVVDDLNWERSGIQVEIHIAAGWLVRLVRLHWGLQVKLIPLKYDVLVNNQRDT